VINLGNGRPYLLKDFIRLVEKCVGKQAKIEILPEQPGDVDRTCADISKAQRLLGYNPQVPFEEGISRTVEWYRIARYQMLHDHIIDMSYMLSPDVSARPSVVDDSSLDERISFTGDDFQDLELSSYVQKASHQYAHRKTRFLDK
jgi:hypothetical protein